MIDNKILKKDLSEIAELLDGHSSMLFSGNDDFYSYRIFLEGFLLGYSHHAGINIMSEISSMIYKDLNENLSIGWLNYIVIYFSHTSDEEKIKMLLNYFKKYIESF